jgi:hypothetical protein
VFEPTKAQTFNVSTTNPITCIVAVQEHLHGLRGLQDYITDDCMLYDVP